MDSLIAHARTLPVRRQADKGSPRNRAASHRPEAMFIACSDARVSPALLTGAGPGQILELRTVGNVVPPYRAGRCCSEAATLTYALEVLAITDIVVCGHSDCGAVRTLSPGGLTTAAFDTWWWLTRTNRHARRRNGDLDPGLAHLRAQLDKLRRYPKVERRLRRGRLRLHGWYYDLQTGTVQALEPDGARLAPL